MSRRKPQPRKKLPKCTYCKERGHTSLVCFSKPRAPIALESPKHKAKRQAVFREWIKLNPPDANGHWICYLQIHSKCPVYLDRRALRLEHIYPKSGYPALIYVVKNNKAACDYCNKLKGSSTLNRLRKWIPRVRQLTETAEWQAWEAEIGVIAEELGIRLDSPPAGQLSIIDPPCVKPLSERIETE